jgi:ribonuclease R
MNELASRIMVVLQKQGKKGIHFKDLTKKLKIKSKHLKEFRLALEELVDQGEVVEKKAKLMASSCFGFLPAQITRVNKTFGFAKLSGEETEYFIPGKFLMGALPGDQVLLKRIPGRGESPEGEVVKLTAKGDGEFTGKIVMENGEYYVLPDNLIKEKLRIVKHGLNGAKNGEKVLARVAYRGKRHSEHKAQVLSAYGDADTAYSCAQAVLELHGVSKEFPLAVLDKAEYLQKRGIKSADYLTREDLRNDVIFTIDGADSMDLDDAVSLTKWEDSYQLGVHIADVSHYVLYQSDIDKEAFYRGTSIYYADQVIPMLPKALSNGICSLNPGEDRLAFSALMTLDLEGNLIDFDFQKTVIRSRVKGVYDEVNALLEGTADQQTEEKYAQVKDSLMLMKELALLRMEKKKQRGAPEIVTHESKIIVGEDGKAADIKPRQSGLAENLIEEFMLLANEAAAMAGKLKGLPFVYRVHEPPAPEKIERLNETLRLLGLQTRELKPNVKPKALAEILEKSKGTPVDSVVNIQILRSMSKAKYSESPLGHYGLALENYAHFTSPIRRYPDLMIHRVLTELLCGKTSEELQRRYGKYVVKSASQSTQTELSAMTIERECEDCYKAEYMKKHLGESFEGIISSVARHGVYVELPNTVEGLIRVEDLPDGEYFFDEVMTYTNITTGKKYKIGDPIQVICSACDVNSGNIDFVPADIEKIEKE